MTVRLYMDVHVPQAITEQLRRREVDVSTAIEDGVDTMLDNKLLERVNLLGRVIFTQDIGFRVMAQEWQRQNKPFAGLIFGHQLGGTIGQYVRDLELITKSSELEEWINVVEFLPF
jgi:hypothetical protein